MAVTTINSNPSFTKEFNNVISLDNLANYQLLSNRESLPIPTDFDGTNPIYTEAIATLNIKQSNSDDTANWVISKYSESNCSVTVDNVTKTATVTAITSDTANFIVKATKIGENTLYKSIVVFKVKDGEDGVDGNGTPDNITIQNNGSNNLETIHINVFDDTEYVDSINIGFGGLTGVRSIPSTNIVRLSAESATNSRLENCTNVIAIGNHTALDRFGVGSATISDGVLVGDNLYIMGSKDSPYTVTGFCMVGIGNSIDPEIRDNTVALGLEPKNRISGSVSISLPEISTGLVATDTYNREFIFKNAMQTVSGGSTGSITLNINTSPTFVKVIISIYGVRTSGGADVMLQEQHMSVANGTTVVNYSDTNELYKSGIFSSEIGGSLTCSYSSDVFTVSIPSLSVGTIWYINFELQIVL